MWAKDPKRIVHTCISSGFVSASLAFIVWMRKLHQMLEALPLFKALSIPVAAFCLTASFVYVGFVIYSWLPRVRWGKTYSEMCSALAKEIVFRDYEFNSTFHGQLLLKVQTLNRELNSYDIHCPPIFINDRSSGTLWKEFLIIVGTYAKQNDLRSARKAFDQMIPESQRKWLELESILAELYV